MPRARACATCAPGGSGCRPAGGFCPCGCCSCCGGGRGGPPTGAPPAGCMAVGRVACSGFGPAIRARCDALGAVRWGRAVRWLPRWLLSSCEQGERENEEAWRRCRHAKVRCPCGRARLSGQHDSQSQHACADIWGPLRSPRRMLSSSGNADCCTRGCAPLCPETAAQRSRSRPPLEHAAFLQCIPRGLIRLARETTGASAHLCNGDGWIAVAADPAPGSNAARAQCVVFSKGMCVLARYSGDSLKCDEIMHDGACAQTMGGPVRRSERGGQIKVCWA